MKGYVFILCGMLLCLSGDALGRMTSEMQGLIEQDCIARWLNYLGLNSACEYSSEEEGHVCCCVETGVFAFKSGSHLVEANRAFLTEPNEQKLKEVQQYFGSLPHCISTFAGDEKSEALLLSAGYERYARYPIMKMSMRADYMGDQPFDVVVPDGVVVRRISDTSQELAVWIDVVARSYAIDKKELAQFVQYLKSTSSWKNMRFFVASLDGIPSAASLLTVHGTIATLHRVGTVPEARGRGLGTVVSSYPLQNLAQEGVQLVALLASQAGRAMYEKIGFETSVTLDLYKKKAAAA